MESMNLSDLIDSENSNMSSGDDGIIATAICAGNNNVSGNGCNSSSSSSSVAVPQHWFLQLPEGLLSEVLTQWLQLPDIAHLDSALLQRSERHCWHQLLQSNNVAVFPDFKELRYRRRPLHHWLALRQISVAALQFGGTVDTATVDCLTAKVCQRVQLLDFSCVGRFNSVDVRPLLQHCGNSLQQLIFWEADYHNVLNEEALLVLADNCSNLQLLSLQNNLHINKTTAAALASRCSQLQELRLQHCYNFGDGALAQFAAHCSVNLRSIHIRNSQEVSVNGIRSLAKHCPNIKSLNYSGCGKITDEAVEVIASAFGLLEQLTLDHTPITNVALESIAEHCFALRQLTVHFCGRLSDDGLLLLHTTVPQLQLLNAEYCSNISAEACELLRQVRPAVQIIHSTRQL